MPRGARVDGAASGALDVLRHMRRDVSISAGLNEALGVVRFVRADLHAFSPTGPIDQRLGGHIALDRSVRGTGLDIDQQAMAVVRQHVAQVARQCRRSMALAVQPRFGVALGFVGGVAARLAVPVLGRASFVRAVLAPHAFVAGPGLDERAVHAEVLARQQPALFGHLHRRVEQFGDRVVLDESVAVFAEHQVVPQGVLHGQAHKPAEQQVVLDLLDQLSLAVHAVQHLQQHCAHEFFRRDAGAASLDVSLVHRR